MLDKQRQPDHVRRALLTAFTFAPLSVFAQEKTKIEVWKTPSCGCCTDWITHLHDNGFEVLVNDVSDTSLIRSKHRIPDEYASCHSGLVHGYALEGHVPAKEIKRLLAEDPKVVGLVVPSMPLGSPGMDGPGFQGRKMPYDVLLIALDGAASVYQTYQ